MDAEPRYILAQDGVTDQLTLSSGSPLDVECASARTQVIDYGAEQLGIVVPRGGPPIYLKLSVQDATMFSRVDINGGGLKVCSDCSMSKCAQISGDSPSTAIFPDGVVIQVDPSGMAGLGLASFLTTVEPL